MTKEMLQERIDKAIEIANEMAYSDYHINAGTDRRAVSKLWENNGQKRTYINIVCYTYAGNYKGRYNCGYIDNITGEYVYTKYDEVNLGL